MIHIGIDPGLAGRSPHETRPGLLRRGWMRTMLAVYALAALSAAVLP